MRGCHCGEISAPKKPLLYLDESFAEFLEQVVKSILDEMWDESGRRIMEMGLAHVVGEIEYDITEDIQEYEKEL